MPEAATLKLTVVPAATVWLLGWVVIVGPAEVTVRVAAELVVLPEEFFRNCAIAIIVLMMGICIITIVRENRKLKVK